MNYVRNVILTILGIVALFAAFVISKDASSATTNFDVAMKTVLKHEGGLSNNSHDPGGITNYGISLRFIKDEHVDINGDGKIDSNDIIHLTKSGADNIYLRNWWLAYHYDEIKNSTVATKIMDFSVNAGACRAHKLVKSSLNHILIQQTNVTCNLDEKDTDAINHIEPVLMMAELRAEEAEFYRSIVKKNASLKPFLKGWLKRAAD